MMLLWAKALIVGVQRDCNRAHINTHTCCINTQAHTFRVFNLNYVSLILHLIFRKCNVFHVRGRCRVVKTSAFNISLPQCHQRSTLHAAVEDYYNVSFICTCSTFKQQCKQL